jgi:3D (Asp-Asp-Asp) domain-containing protein
MKSLLVKAVASAIAIGTLASCSGLSVGSTSKSRPRLLSKAQAEKLSASWSRLARNTFLPASVDLAVKASAQSLPTDKHGRPTYKSDSARHRVVRTTSYSHQEGEVGAPGRLNAIGTTLKYGQVRSAAADWSRYPVGTTFRIKGLPHTYVIDDYGSALVGTNTIDIYHPSLGLMRKWATRDVEINIIKWGSWERTANLLRGRIKYGHCARMYYATMRKLSSNRVAQRRPSATPTF